MIININININIIIIIIIEMSFWKYLIIKNLRIWSKHYLKTTILLFLPVIVFFLISLYFQNRKIKRDYTAILHLPIQFNWHNPPTEGQWEVEFLRDTFKNQVVGIIFDITNQSKIEKYNKNTFWNYITNEETGVCCHSNNCTWLELKNESIIYWGISESIRLEVNKGSPQYKIYSSSVPIYSRDNQISEWYNIPSQHGVELYSQALQVYFAKYLIEITRDGNKNQATSKQINISLYHMRVDHGIKIVDSHDITNSQESIWDFIILYFTLSSVAFVSLIILLTEAWIKEKIKRITDLLQYQGISKKQYILSWLVSYLIVNLLPMMLFIICFTVFWVGLKWSCIWLLTGIIVLYYLNIFVFCIWCTSFINRNNPKKWWIYVCYWSPIFWYLFFLNADGCEVIRQYYFYFLPNINFVFGLQLIFLLSNYQTGATLSRLVTTYKSTNFIILLIQNIAFLIFWTISLLIIENGRCSCKHRKSITKFDPGRSSEVKLDISNSNDDKSNSTIWKQTKIKRCFELMSDLSFTQQYEINECLCIRNIVKKFGDFVAVNNISLDWFKGQIFVLLGHNGAGKTTLLNIISGNMIVDQGDILFEYHYWLEDKQFLYSNLGLCGQEDIYFPDLTVYEQIELLSNLKGKNKKNETEALELITCLGWKEYVNSRARTLSTGNWRKLCTAFALLGNSKLVIWDEPTSGMDFKSKKLFWDFLKTIKQNRIIILTTHSMEEAEYWGDNIGIMSEGELICRGSSSFLKRNYPCGYNINFVFLNNSITLKEKNDLINTLRKSEPGMTIKIISKDWIKLNFPESSFQENKINKLFKTIEQVKDKYKIKDYTVSTTSLEEVFCKVNDIDFAKNWFEIELEETMKTISQENTTENFFFVDEKTETNKNENHKNNAMNTTQQEQSSINVFDFDFSLSNMSLWNNDNNDDNGNKSTLNTRGTLPKKKGKNTFENRKKFSAVIESKHERFLLSNNQILKHCKRNFLSFYRNIVGSLARFLICLSLTIWPIIMEKVLSLNQDYNYISLSNFFPKRVQTSYNIVNYDKTNSESKTINELTTEYESMFSLNKFDLQIDSYDKLNYIDISKNTDFGKNKNFLLVEYNDRQVNYTNFYSLSSPDIKHVMLNSIIRKQLLEEYGVTTFLFDSYARVNLEVNNMDIKDFTKNIRISSYSAISYLLFSFFCISLPFNDKKSEVKAMIMINSGNMYKYWAGLFLFDYFKFVILTIIITIVFYFTFLDLVYLFPISLLFGINMIISAYLSTTVFKSENTAKTTYFIINIIVICCYNFGSFIMNFSIIPYLDFLPAASMVHYFYTIQDDYENLVWLNDSPSSFIGFYFKTWIFSFFHFVLQFIFLLLLYNVIEKQKIRKMCCCCKSWKGISNNNRSRKSNFYSIKMKGDEKWLSDDLDISNWIDRSRWIPLSSGKWSNSDEDIADLSEWRISKSSDKFILHLNDISVKYKKSWGKDIPGVTNITLKLEPNERFALMGLNNSGKSTIIKTISNILNYEKGFIKFSDYFLPKDFDLIRNNMGYCPEQNSLFPYLTVFETFDYYYKGEMINVSTSNHTVINSNDSESTNKRKNNIYRWIQEYGLSKYSNVLTINLSGGNKRKLLLAIALMNNPQLALLDEPSTGVDPDSRRLMWKNISSIYRKNRSLGYNFNWLLSTQSIEEAELLCDSWGWLKKGSLVYLGNSENWKIELSEGYYMKICFKKPSQIDFIDNFIIYENPNLKNLDNVDGISTLNIDKIIKEKKMEMLYYLFYWDEICGLWVENKTKIKYVDYIENSFKLILNIQSNKCYIFSNLLNLKNIYQNISELTLSIQQFESIIENF